MVFIFNIVNVSPWFTNILTVFLKKVIIINVDIFFIKEIYTTPIKKIYMYTLHVTFFKKQRNTEWDFFVVCFCVFFSTALFLSLWLGIPSFFLFTATIVRFLLMSYCVTDLTWIQQVFKWLGMICKCVGGRGSGCWTGWVSKKSVSYDPTWSDRHSDLMMPWENESGGEGISYMPTGPILKNTLLKVCFFPSVFFFPFSLMASQVLRFPLCLYSVNIPAFFPSHKLTTLNFLLVRAEI